VLSYYQERSQVRTPFNPGPDFPAPGTGGQPGPQRLAFALADQNGRVLIPAGEMQEGTVVASAVLEQGTPVTVGSQRVGTVLLAGSLPVLGGLEQRYLNSTNLGLLYSALRQWRWFWASCWRGR
jgi:hypothetical protein